MSNHISIAARAHGIAVNVAALRRLLFRAYYLTNEAHSCAAVGNCQSAIGALAGLDILLRDASAFLGATTALHCSPHISTEGMPRAILRPEPKRSVP